MGLQHILGQAEGEQLRAELLGERIVLMSVASDEVSGHDALPKTNSSPPKIGLLTPQKERIVFQPSIFRCELLVLGMIHVPICKEGRSTKAM